DRIDKHADQISTLVDIFAKKVVTPALVKMVEESSVTSGGPHAHYNCDDTNSNQPSVCVTTGTLPSNTIINPKGEMKAITTRSGVAYEGPSIPTNPYPKKTLPKPNIPYPLRLNDQKLREKATNLMDKFFQIFQDLYFDISFADSLLLMPKFASTIKSLLTNKDNTSEPIIFDSSPSLTSFEGSDFILEEIEAYLKNESISPEIDHADCDPEGDIYLIEKLLNNGPFQLPPMDFKQREVVKVKSSIEEPSKLELKDLPSHLEYAYLEGVDKLPVIIAKDLKDDEKESLLKVLKSHKRAIA
nr:reverse transcriptase domain-containing protein [Tanacetum cinerariifolium]